MTFLTTDKKLCLFRISWLGFVDRNSQWALWHHQIAHNTISISPNTPVTLLQIWFCLNIYNINFLCCRYRSNIPKVMDPMLSLESNGSKGPNIFLKAISRIKNKGSKPIMFVVHSRLSISSKYWDKIIFTTILCSLLP